MADDDIQILEPPPPFPDLEDGEICDVEINVTSEVGNNDEVMVVEDCDFVLDDEGLGIADDTEISSEKFSKAVAPISLKFGSEAVSSSRRSNGCFNCGGAHNVMDCKNPIDSERITQNRRSFNDNNKMRETRITQNQRNKFHPGVISNYARQALGLTCESYPPWIKRMRSEGLLQGYPPGWLERLMPKTSKLEFFTEDPTLSNQKDGNANAFKIDRNQIIYYEGFNDIDLDAIPERILRNQGHGILVCSKEEYADKLEAYAKRKFESRLQQEADAARREESQKKKRRHAQNEDYGGKRARLEPPGSAPTIAPPTDEQNNNPINTEMEVDSPASPTLPPVVSKSLTYDQAEPEELTFPLVSDAQLPPANNWAEGITPFKHDNVIEGGSGLHRSIHQILKNFSKDSK